VLALSGVFALYPVVNALSVAQECKGQVAPWQPCVWAASSAVAMAVLVPVIALLTHRLRPPRMSRPLAVAAHAVAALVIGLTHVGTMVALRHLAYVAHGWAYTFAFDTPTLGYELHKDVRSYALIPLGYALWRRLRRPLPVWIANTPSAGLCPCLCLCLCPWPWPCPCPCPRSRSRSRSQRHFA